MEKFVKNFLTNVKKLYNCLNLKRSPVAQSVEQMTVNHWVAGSSPAWGAISIFHLIQFPSQKLTKTSFFVMLNSFQHLYFE